MEHHSRVGEGPVLPLLLVLGFANGYSIWQILVRGHSLCSLSLFPMPLVFSSLEKWEGIDALMLLSRHMGKGGEV